MMTAEALPGFAGAGPIPFVGEDERRNNRYIAYVLHGSSYFDSTNRDNTIRAITDLKSETYAQEAALTRSFVEKEIISPADYRRGAPARVQAIERRGTAILVVERRNPTEIVAGLTARELAIDASLTQEGYMDVLLTTRVVKEGFRDDGVGTFMALQASLFHGEAQMHAIRTQSAVPIWSDIEAHIFREDSLFPFARRYNVDAIAHQVMINLDGRIKRRTIIDTPNDETGVARKEYGRKLIDFRPKEGHDQTNELQITMEKLVIDGGLGMEIEEGDALYVMDYAMNYRGDSRRGLTGLAVRT